MKELNELVERIYGNLEEPFDLSDIYSIKDLDEELRIKIIDIYQNDYKNNIESIINKKYNMVYEFILDLQVSLQNYFLDNKPIIQNENNKMRVIRTIIILELLNLTNKKMKRKLRKDWQFQRDGQIELEEHNRELFMNIMEDDYKKLRKKFRKDYI